MKYNFEYYITRLILIGGVLFVGFFSSKYLVNLLYTNETNKNFSILAARYDEQIAQETDPYKLAKYGMSFLQNEDNETGLKCFQKVTQLDGEWRDGWVWKGYAELKINESKKGLISLKKAEKIDPIYPLTYQLLTIAYQQTGDFESAKFSQEKLVYLSETYIQ